MRIITDAPRNVDVGSVYKMVLVHSREDLSSLFGSVANVTLSRLIRNANTQMHVTLINIHQLLILP